MLSSDLDTAGTDQADPDAVAGVYSQKIDDLGPRPGTEETRRKHPGWTAPTTEELSDLARREELSVIYLSRCEGSSRS